MSIFTDIFAGGVDKVVDSVADGLDNLFTSDMERLQLRNKLQEEMNKLQVEMEDRWIKHEQEITKRWTSDNEHIITRLVRPASFAWIIVLFSVVMIGDNAWGINVEPAYIPVLQTLLTTMTIAYFGARTFDKYSKNKHKAGNE